MPTPKKKPAQKTVKKVNIEYTPSNGLATMLASGSMSSITPDGLINLAFYVERQSFPASSFLDVMENGDVVEGEDIFSDDAGIVREVTHSILIQERTARFLIRTLTNALADLKHDGSENAIETSGSSAA